MKTKTEKESELNDTKKDLAGTQKELDAALVTRRVQSDASHWTLHALFPASVMKVQKLLSPC